LRLTPLLGTEDEREFAATIAPAYDGDTGGPIELLRQTRAFLEANPRPDPWGSYVAWKREAPVGVCAFKFAPDASGAVEIAYGTFPVHRGRGVARAMIRALCGVAFRAGASAVLARTRPENDASNGALRGQGFGFAGEVIDPEDGPVWEWRLGRS